MPQENPHIRYSLFVLLIFLDKTCDNYVMGRHLFFDSKNEQEQITDRNT